MPALSDEQVLLIISIIATAGILALDIGYYTKDVLASTKDDGDDTPRPNPIKNPILRLIVAIGIGLFASGMLCSLLWLGHHLAPDSPYRIVPTISVGMFLLGLGICLLSIAFSLLAGIFKAIFWAFRAIARWVGR